MLLALLLGAAVVVETTPSQQPSFPEPPQAQFKRDVSAILARAQMDPDFAGIKADANGMRATLYFKGDATRHLENFTNDPRIDAESVPVSEAELRQIGEQFVAWLTSRDVRGSVIGIDGRESRVDVSVYAPETVLKAARADHLDMTYLHVGDAVPHYAPERG